MSCSSSRAFELSSNLIEIALGDAVCLVTKVCSLRSSTLLEVEGRIGCVDLQVPTTQHLATLAPYRKFERGRINGCIRMDERSSELCL